MKWAEVPTCHAGERVLLPKFQHNWRPPEPETRPYSRPFRTCAFCGCIHPGDLLQILEEQADRVTFDRNSGLIRKFYINNIRSPLEGQQAEFGREADGTPIMGTIKDTWAKFYVQHLLDEGIDDEAFEALSRHVSLHTGIQFERVGDKIQYRIFPRRPV
jgi:hypothetical protein